MPVATINPQEYERFELKSAPADPNDPNDEDGYVMLRPLPYGMKLSRRSKATKMMMRSQPAQQGGRSQRGKQQQQDAVFEVESMDEWAVAFDFAYCIGDHNLTTPDKKPINFQEKTHFVIRMLDPKIGSEIERLIDQLNNTEDEESFEDFLKRPDTPSSGETASLETDGQETQTELETV
jgi:hypothetical protein